jgi:hypothetical protein
VAADITKISAYTRPLTMSAGLSNQAGTSSQASISDAELEKLLNREASAFQRELEVNRILKAFKLKYVFVFSDIHTSPFNPPVTALMIS